MAELVVIVTLDSMLLGKGEATAELYWIGIDELAADKRSEEVELDTAARPDDWMDEEYRFVLCVDVSIEPLDRLEVDELAADENAERVELDMAAKPDE